MDDFYRKVSKGRLYRFGEKLSDLMSMSLLWFVFCLPVITFVPSCAALYYAARKRKFMKSGAPSKDFLHSFKSNLKQGIIINIIYLIYSAITAANIFIGYYGIGDINLPSFYFPLSLLLLLPLIFSFPFVIPCLARYENTTKNTFINGFTLSTLYFGKSILVCITMLVTLAILIVFPPAILFLPALSAIFITSSLENAFLYTEKKMHGDTVDTSYDEENEEETEELLETEDDHGEVS